MWESYPRLSSRKHGTRKGWCTGARYEVMGNEQEPAGRASGSCTRGSWDLKQVEADLWVLLTSCKYFNAIFAKKNRFSAFMITCLTFETSCWEKGFISPGNSKSFASTGRHNLCFRSSSLLNMAVSGAEWQLPLICRSCLTHLCFCRAQGCHMPQ